MNITPEEMDTLEEKTFKLRLRIAELERDLEEKTDVIASQADKISKLEDEVKHLKEMLELVKSRPSVVMDNPTFQGHRTAIYGADGRWQIPLDRYGQETLHGRAGILPGEGVQLQVHHYGQRWRELSRGEPEQSVWRYTPLLIVNPGL